MTPPSELEQVVERELGYLRELSRLWAGNGLANHIANDTIPLIERLINAARSTMGDDAVERIARALCKADGDDPERLEPGDDPYQGRAGFRSPCIDGYNRNDEPCHFAWRRYDEQARAALSAPKGQQ